MNGVIKASSVPKVTYKVSKTIKAVDLFESECPFLIINLKVLIK